MYKVLVIDDEEALLKNIGGFLKLKGYSALTSLNGKEGLELLRTEDPQLLILDMHLKEGPTGIQVLREAKMVKKDLKVVVITGFGEEDETKARCISLGINAFLSKPITLKELGETIKNVLGVE